MRFHAVLMKELILTQPPQRRPEALYRYQVLWQTACCHDGWMMLVVWPMSFITTCGRPSSAAHTASVVDMQALAEEASFWRQPTHAVRMSVERLRCRAACHS